MKTETIKNIILLLAVCSFTACNKWLDVKPSTQLDRDELFKSEEGYRDALLGVYSSLSAPALYGREMTFGTMDVLAGYYAPLRVSTTTYADFYAYYPYKQQGRRIDANIAVLDRMWSGIYHTISNLNSILETIDMRKGMFSDDNYRIVKGEAIGLRAFLHLDLLRMYGVSHKADPLGQGIPFVDTLASVVSPVLNMNQAADRIIIELETALALMENDPIKTGIMPATDILATQVSTTALEAYHNRKFHFNYYAVAGALARAYQWRGDKANALKYAKIVIEAQSTRFPWVLDANLSAISSTTAANKDRTFTTEHLFALNIMALEDYVPNYFTSSGRDRGLQLFVRTATRNLIYENNTVDPRSQYLFVSQGTDLFPTKFYQDDIVSPWFKYQIPLMRVSEMYYIAAESEPDLQQGLVWLNTVRGVRKLPVLSAATITTSMLLQTEIQKEYQKEFLGEGQLWFYYKRQHFTSLPYNTGFNNTNVYVFDMPEDEYVYGGRE